MALARRVSQLLVSTLFVLALACDLESTPPPNRDFVGAWASKDGSHVLSISVDGDVSYRKQEDGVNTSIDAPAKVWSESSFTVGAFGISTNFTIDEAPHLVEGAWRMTVDGVEYQRVE